MATTVFNLSAVDRIEADVRDIQSTQAAQTAAIMALAQNLQTFITALGGGDQPTIDAATTALQTLTSTLNAAVESNQPGKE
jgi:ABC-type transporter Mla subunit MlaD